MSDGDHGLRIRVDGKTGQRTVDLVTGFSIPHVQRWLSEHPAPNDPDAPLWSKLNKPERYSYQRFLHTARFTEGGRVRVDIPDETDPDHERYHGVRRTVVAVLEDDAGRTTGDERDSPLFRVELEDGDVEDFRWRDLRPP